MLGKTLDVRSITHMLRVDFFGLRFQYKNRFGFYLWKCSMHSIVLKVEENNGDEYYDTGLKFVKKNRQSRIDRESFSHWMRTRF